MLDRRAPARVGEASQRSHRWRSRSGSADSERSRPFQCGTAIRGRCAEGSPASTNHDVLADVAEIADVRRPSVGHRTRRAERRYLPDALLAYQARPLLTGGPRSTGPIRPRIAWSRPAVSSRAAPSVDSDIRRWLHAGRRRRCGCASGCPMPYRPGRQEPSPRAVERRWPRS